MNDNSIEGKPVMMRKFSDLKPEAARSSQRSQQLQHKQMQNYLNQSFKESENAAQSLNGEEENEPEEIIMAEQQLQQPPLPPQQAAPNRNLKISQQNHNTSALSISQNDPRKGDVKYACLRVRQAEFFCSRESLVKHSNYMLRVFEKQDYLSDVKERSVQCKIKLPESTKIDVLIMFLDHLDRGKELPNKLDLYIAQNVVLIAEALRMRQIQKRFLMEVLTPMLNRENIIFFTKMAYNKLSVKQGTEDQDDLESQASHQEEEECWFDFFSYTLDVAAQWVLYLLKAKSQELLSVLEPSIVEEIIERAIKFYRADMHYDSSLLFETLIKLRKCDSIFQLLDQERAKIIEKEESIIAAQENIKPTLTWKIQNQSASIIRESDAFMVEGSFWKLSLLYQRNDEDALYVKIKMFKNPCEVKKSKDYYKKNELLLCTNVAGGLQNQPNPFEEQLDQDNMTEEEIVRKRKQQDLANLEYPSHAFITIASSVRIDGRERLPTPTVHTLIASGKAPAVLRKFSPFDVTANEGNVTVEIYFKMQHTYSAILFYISRNFTYLITEPSISLLPKPLFKLLLKHKFLNVTQEDEVMKAICMWIEGQEPHAGLDEDLGELLENVNWTYVSLQCLLDMIRNFPQIRRNSRFQALVTKEFAFRNKFNPETSNMDAPRFCYKYSKVQSMAKPNTKNAKSLLYINHENFYQQLVSALLEPVDIIKSHLVNEGVNESSHRKHLELQLLHKKREIAYIEEQLSHMRVMEEINRANALRNSHKVKNNGGRFVSSQAKQTTNKLSLNQNSEGGDDLETVKNSMINLLNVVLEEQPASKNNLVEISNDAVQKMMAPNPPVFQDMYDDLNLIDNNKAQIVFRKTTSEKQGTGSVQSLNESSSNAVEEGEESEVQSFQSSKIEVGGGNIASPGVVRVDQELQAPTYLRMINESIGVQTSLKQLKSSSLQMLPKASLPRALVDQGVQLTFEEPEFDKASSMIKPCQEHHDVERFLSHQASSLSSVRGEVIRSSFQQADSDEEDAHPDPVPFLSPQQENNHAQPDYSSNNSLDRSHGGENDQHKMFEQMKLKYQKQLMQEYTQMMEQMSKDMFDANFLKNFQLLKASVDWTADPNFQAPYSPPPNQTQPAKVHNLNISIHNNANYGAPYPVETLPTSTFTPASQQQQQNAYNGTAKIPMKNQVKSPTSITQKTTPKGQQSLLKQAPKAQSVPQAKHKPQSASYSLASQIVFDISKTLQHQTIDTKNRRPQSSKQSSNSKPKNFKKPQNFENLQIESGEEPGRLHTPLPPHVQSAKHTYTTVSVKGQQGIFAGNAKAGKGLNSPQLAQYVNQMPNSTKNNVQASKSYNYQTQQQAHQKVVKASAINKSQNKVILQQILNDNGASLSVGNGTFVNQTTIGGDVSIGEGRTHHKTRSQPQGMWTTASNGVMTHGTREKSGEHGMMVDESSFHQQEMLKFNTSYQLGQKRQSVPTSQAVAQYAANFNILDQLKQKSTPQYNPIAAHARASSQCSSQSNGGFVQNQAHFSSVGPYPTSGYSDMKQQTSGFGSLATHQKQTTGVVLDLAKLKSVVSGQVQKQYYVERGNELCTIEESKRSEAQQDSDSQYMSGKMMGLTLEAMNGGQSSIAAQSRPDLPINVAQSWQGCLPQQMASVKSYGKQLNSQQLLAAVRGVHDYD